MDVAHVGTGLCRGIGGVRLDSDTCHPAVSSPAGHSADSGPLGFTTQARCSRVYARHWQ